MQALRNFAMNETPTALAVAILLVFVGAGIAAKADSKWGYVLMVLAVIFGVFVLKTKRMLGFG